MVNLFEPNVHRPDVQDRETLWKMIAFLLEQVGGSIALSPDEQARIMKDPMPNVKFYQTELGNLIIRLEED